jgi:hypothetical protein
LHVIEVDASLVENIAKEISTTLLNPWYADFDNGVTRYIIVSSPTLELKWGIAALPTSERFGPV